MKKYYLNSANVLLFAITLLSYIVFQKELYIGPKLTISASLILYPFTFLIIAKMFENNSINNIKKAIYTSFTILLLFYFFISIINSLDSILNTELISSSLREIFTPNHFTIFNTIIYYPNIVTLLSFSVIFFITHYVFAVLYEIITGYTNYIITFILSILISFTLDQLLLIPLNTLPSLIDKTVIYKELIEKMTASFITVIFSSFLMLIIYSIIKKKN